MIKVSETKEYYMLENTADVEEMLGVLQDVDVIAVDTETTGLNVRKETIVGYSFSYQEGQGFYVPIYSWDGEKLVNHRIKGTRALLEALAEKQTVMHNASFDCRILKNNIGVDFLTNLLSDTVLMQHTLNEEGPFGLKELAIENAELIGMSKDDVANQEQIELEENVKAKGGSWKKTDKDIYKADLHVLAKYAIADTDLTLRLFNLFSQQLKKEKLEKFFYEEEVMPLYKEVTLVMEDRGVHLDMDKLMKLIEEINADITRLEAEVTEAILDTEEGEAFISRRIEDEIEVKSGGSFGQAVAEYYRLDLPKNEKGKYSLAAKNVKALPDSPVKAFLEGHGQLDEAVVESIKFEMLKKDGPIININSKQQLGMLVFDIMKIKALSSTDKGSPQFNEEFVEHLAEKNLVSWASKLRVYNKLVKILGSSYQRFLDEQEDGVFYPYYKQHGTTSGRYSSNLQQLPRPIEKGEDDPLIEKYTNEIRSLIIAPEEYIFIDDDYASLEPSVFAHDAEDQPLIDIFVKGEDFYSKVAIMALGLEASADKKAANFLKNINPKARQDAKAYALGIRYGAEEGKVSQLLDITKDAAKEIVNNYFGAFPKLKAKMEQYKTEAKRTGKVTSEFGRVRHLPEVKQIYKTYGDDILDYNKLRDVSKKHYVPFRELMDIRKRYKNLLNNALNFPIQSAATTVINKAVIAVTREFAEKGIDGWVCGVIHDQAIYCVNDGQKTEAAEIVQRCMEQTTKLRVPLYAVPQFAHNWRDGH